MPEKPLIRMRGIEKSHRHGPLTAWVLRGIDLDVDRGEFVTIMGPSGAGKTTLLNIIGMLDSPTGGEYRFLGEPIQDLGARERADLYRAHVGFIFQSYHLIDDLTVRENIEMPLLYMKTPKTEREKRVRDMLARFGLAGRESLCPGQLSGGQQQRAGVARAVVADPDLLLADEPTGNLHTEESEEIMELFAELNRGGTTIVQATHSEKNASYGSRVVHLKDGWIVADEQN